MSRSEAETRAQLIDPALRARGWIGDLVFEEVTAGAVDIVGGKPVRRGKRADYVLRVRPFSGGQPVAVAVIEAKPENVPPARGLQQGKGYASARRLNVPFVIASNGHLFVLYDTFSGLTTPPQPMADLPSPDNLRARYEVAKGFALTDEAARPLAEPYLHGEGSRRYYQDAAIRAVLERIAQGNNRVLLSLATGAGKTFIAVNLLHRIATARQLTRALFLCDRDELRSQALAAFQGAFGADAAAVTGSDPAANARVLVATYQTLGLDADADDEQSFLARHYPENHFSHIVIDECHRSAWGDWSEALKRNPNAIHVGLTATPRRLIDTLPDDGDGGITADNLAYFGEPAYTYDLAQGIEDGYLAACEVVRRDIFLERKDESERVTGFDARDLVTKNITDARTGEILDARKVAEERPRYDASSFERTLLMPDRVEAMADDLFAHLLATGGPEQKTIVFCARDSHADDVAIALNNRYAAWCAQSGLPRAEPYAFKCTAASSGNDQLADFRGAQTRWFVATTVDLLTTGVDVPAVRNVVFMKYVQSPIAFSQMVGRGTRIHAETNKLMFRVYDYTDATRLFGEEFLTRAATDCDPAGPDPERRTLGTYRVDDVEVRIDGAERLVVARVDGVPKLLPVEDYKALLAHRIREEAGTLDDFRHGWIDPARRRHLLDALVGAGLSPTLVRHLDDMADFDLYDVLAGLAYGATARTRLERAGHFLATESGWLGALPKGTAAAIRAIANQFALGGTDELESRQLFSLPQVAKAGGLIALTQAGAPGDVLYETKSRMFSA